MVSLERATMADAEAIFEIQIIAFRELLERYQDFSTNPGNESIERVITRINNPNGGFYKILDGNTLVGAVCVYWKEETNYWISPMFILPAYQGKGIAQQAIQLLEALFPQATSWELKTLLEEKRNCYLYEKMGYTLTGVKYPLNEKATLVHYLKACSTNN
jgi:GNAT superfamily N-acetyltransferase